MKKILTRLHIFLSHHSYLYAVSAGVGIVLFWRGVWHSVDSIHNILGQYQLTGVLSSNDPFWWDGPLSFFVGVLLLLVTRAFVSSFIGNELILSGLRTEERMTKETDSELKTEMTTITDIKKEIDSITHALSDLESDIKDHHKKRI